MKEIRGDAKNIRTLLGGTKFAIDYYQREYRWKTKQVTELIDDLMEKFQECHEAGNERREIEQYGHYFLGSIIINDKEGQKFIVDGQQRLTSLTLILIHLYHETGDGEQKRELANLIKSYQVGRSSYNLDIPEREECMDALFKKQPFDDTDKPESVVNIVGRFQDIKESFAEILTSEILTSEMLPYFADWLIENVLLVEITAYSDSDAYTIFESMNDRGLSLSQTDMLKGYLLNEITDENIREKARGTWRERVKALKRLDDKDKDNDSNAIKAWLRSQYAENITIRETIREKGRGKPPGDFYLIGSGFYRWVRSNETEKLDLRTKADFGPFIQKSFDFYARQYERIHQAASTLTPGLEAIHYNDAWNKFTLQYPVLLAPLRRDDSEDEIESKLRIVANYLDILIARRIWNGRGITHSTMLHKLFDPIILGIRREPIPKLVEFLINHLKNKEETFTNPRFGKHGRNGRQIHQLLARMLGYIETKSGLISRYTDYIKRGRKDGYEIEHIWADHYRDHKDEFDDSTEFSDYRNRIGGLLLLSKSHNASLNDMPYKGKREHYLKQNLLAQSLHEMAYQKNPGFLKFNDDLYKKTGLKFEAHSAFEKADLNARQKLYQTIAEQIWNPENLLLELEN